MSCPLISGVVELRLKSPYSGRLQILDELKGLAIILIVLYHAGGVLDWTNTLHEATSQIPFDTLARRWRDGFQDLRFEL